MHAGTCTCWCGAPAWKCPCDWLDWPRSPFQPTASSPLRNCRLHAHAVSTPRLRDIGTSTLERLQWPAAPRIALTLFVQRIRIRTDHVEHAIVATFSAGFDYAVMLHSTKI